MENSCLLRAVLIASAALGRPLKPRTVARLVHIIERNKGWPLGRVDELFYLLRDLGCITLIQSEAYTTVADGVPIIVLYGKGKSSHAEFGYAPTEWPNKIHALFILEPKGTKA